MDIETKCIHAGYEPKNGEPRMLPIVQSTTFKYDTSEDMGMRFDLQAHAKVAWVNYPGLPGTRYYRIALEQALAAI